MGEMTESPQFTAPPSEWVDRIFQRLAGMYGSKWLDLWRGTEIQVVKEIWREDLTGYQASEIKRGLDLCKSRVFPPTLPEFLICCRPALDYEQLYISAANAINDGRWQNKLAYWAAQSVGAFNVRNQPYKRMENTWKKTVDELLADGDLPGIPPRREVLPSPGKTSVDQAEAIKRIGVAVSKIAPPSDFRAWARKIIGNPKDYPAISVRFANDALSAPV